MSRRKIAIVLFLLITFAASVCSMPAQTSAVDGSSLPRVIRFGGVLKESPKITVGVIFAIYDKQDSVSPIWLETQSVTTDETGHYNVILGSTNAAGLPASIFANGEA